MFENIYNSTTKCHILTVMDDKSTDVIAVMEFRPESKVLVMKIYQSFPIEMMREATKFFEKDDYDKVIQILYIKAPRKIFELALEEEYKDE